MDKKEFYSLKWQSMGGYPKWLNTILIQPVRRVQLMRPSARTDRSEPEECFGFLLTSIKISVNLNAPNMNSEQVTCSVKTDADTIVFKDKISTPGIGLKLNAQKPLISW